VPGTQTFEIRDFVPGASIDDFYFTQPYYVAPAGRRRPSRTRLPARRARKSGRVGVRHHRARQRYTWPR